MTTPQIEPTAVRAGDTIAWTRSLSDYPASAGWVLSYRLINATGKIDITATAAGSDHAVAVTAATSAGWTAGAYSWISYVTKAAERFTIGEGSITVQPNLAAQAGGFDTRTHAAKVLASIEAWLESKDPAVAEYEIAGRRMKYIPVAELLKMRDAYRLEVNTENAAARSAVGLAPKNKLFVRI